MLIDVSKEEYELIMDLRKPRVFYKNEYVLYDDYAEIILKNEYGHERTRALIDLEDIETIKEIGWFLGANGYVTGYHKNKKNISLHKMITKTGSRELVDHIDGNKLNNKKSNLRTATHQQNCFNKKAIGVRKTKSNKYQAYITKDKKQINLGVYENIEDAIKARKQGEKEYFKEYAYKGI